jgi:hypothetical protein
MTRLASISAAYARRGSVVAYRAMSRTPVLTAMLWGVAMGCGGDSAPIVDAASIDAPPVDGLVAIDAPIDGPPPAVNLATALAMDATCGGGTTTADLVITNVAGAAVIVTAIDVGGGFFTKTALPLTIPIGDQVSVTVYPPSAVIGTDRGGATVTGTLTVTTDLGGAPPPVTLTSTIIGANLALVDSGGQALTQVALDSATAACPPPTPVFVRNTGNAAADLFTSGASNFVIGGFTPSSTVPAGGVVSAELSVSTFSECAGSETISYQATGAVCTATPLALAASFNITGTSVCFCS